MFGGQLHSTLGGVAVDVVAQGVAPDDSVIGDAGWRSIAGLATAVVAVLAFFLFGVLLPYLVNGPMPVEIASDAHPHGLGPQDGWTAAVMYPVLLAVLVTGGFGPLVLLAAIVVGAVWLSRMWRRPEPERLSRSLALIVIMSASVAALLFCSSDVGLALTAWQRD